MSDRVQQVADAICKVIAEHSFVRRSDLIEDRIIQVAEATIAVADATSPLKAENERLRDLLKSIVEERDKYYFYPEDRDLSYHLGLALEAARAEVNKHE